MGKGNHFLGVVPYLFGKFNYVVSIELLKFSMHHVQFLCLIIFIKIFLKTCLSIVFNISFGLIQLQTFKKYPTLIDSFFMFIFRILIAKKNCDIFCI